MRKKHVLNSLYIFTKKWNPLKLFFKILPTVFERYYLLFDNTYFRGHLSPAILPQAAGYHPIVQLRLFETNESSSKCL